jgi:hypothetical protein
VRVCQGNERVSQIRVMSKPYLVMLIASIQSTNSDRPRRKLYIRLRRRLCLLRCSKLRWSAGCQRKLVWRSMRGKVGRAEVDSSVGDTRRASTLMVQSSSSRHVTGGGVTGSAPLEQIRERERPRALGMREEHFISHTSYLPKPCAMLDAN